MVTNDRTNVVTVFLHDDSDRVLVLKRSNDVRTYPGQWGGVSGYLETVDPLLQAEREVREETGLGRSERSLVRRGGILAVDDDEHDRHWRVHTFLFKVCPDAGSIELGPEHDEYRWIHPDKLETLSTVPALVEAWKRTR